LEDKKEYICIHLNANNICEFHDCHPKGDNNYLPESLFILFHPFSSFFILFHPFSSFFFEKGRKRQKKAEKGRKRQKKAGTGQRS